MKVLKLIVGLAFLLIPTAGLMMLTPGCGPKAPELATTIQQSFSASNLSVLSQVDWKQVMTSLKGKVGPRTRVLAEAFTKISTGIELTIEGAEISIETTASGTGGKSNSDVFPELVAVQQRWEKADDADRLNKAKWTQEVLAALLKIDARQKNAESQPASHPAQ